MSQFVWPIAGCGSNSTSDLPPSQAVGQQQSNSTAPSRTLILERSSGSPGEFLRFHSTALDTNAAATIIFTDAQGYRVAVELPPVKGNLIQLPLPPYFQTDAQGVLRFSAGTVSITVQQSIGEQVISLGPVNFTIGDLPEPSGTPGAATVEQLNRLLTQSALLESDLTAFDADTRWTAGTSRLRSELALVKAGLETFLSEIRRLSAGEVDELRLGMVGGQETVLTRDNLVLLDVLLPLYLPSNAESTELTLARERVLLALLQSQLSASSPKAREVRPLVQALPVLYAFFFVYVTHRVFQAYTLDTPGAQADKQTLNRLKEGLGTLWDYLFAAVDVSVVGQAIAADDLAQIQATDVNFPHLLDPSQTAAGQALGQVQAHLDNMGINTEEADILKEFLADPPFPAPVARADSYQTRLNQPLQVTATSGLLANDTLHRATLAASSTSTQRGGTVNVAADGSFSYTPPPFFFGTDEFSYSISNTAASRSASATIEVQPTLSGIWSEGGTVIAPGTCAGISDTAVMVLEETNGVVSGSLTYQTGGFTDPVSGSYNAQTRQVILVTQTFNSVLVGTVSADLRNISGTFENGLHCYDSEGQDLGATAGVWGASR
ncbi:MAG: cadherin-like domain-containing protein [Candidatus Eremiobacteraeota bacterium]|nr:cadherin-like domain-containing protein [Candidatus Eremiobacteraeota bacterium]MCW5865917.1 cadherin-like domain-containing protein [Candidatus Eremiobacteraeota bacterium]